MSLYRKYRPQKFADLVGQDHIKKVLTNAISQNKVGHAYLFSGSRGIGKTTIARLLAKALNCQENSKFKIQNSKLNNYEPCNECISCLEITNDRSLDVVEIDAASNRGIDEIRELREKIRFAPTNSPYKVYIIDEVHMLTREAFNALLKTLEEPPSHAVFIMATTELHKVPETILSRTQQFDFKRASLGEIKKYLVYLCQQEKIDIDEQSQELIAVSSEGSFRDAASLLDQISSISQEKISIEQTREVLGLVEEKIIEDFLVLLEDNQAQKAIELLEDIYQKGYDLVQFNQSLIEFLRKKMLRDKNYSLAKLIKRFIEAGQDLKYAAVPQIPLELAVIESCNTATQEHKNIITNNQDTITNQIPNLKSEILNHKSKILNLQSQWLEIVEQVSKENHSLALLLKESEPLKIEEEKLHLAVKFKFYSERIMAKDKYAILTSAIEKVFGEKLAVECAVEEVRVKSKSKEEIPSLTPAERPAQSRSENSEVFSTSNLVDDALEVFGG